MTRSRLAGQLSANSIVVTPKLFELPMGGGTGAGEGQYTFGVRPEDVLVESGAPVEAKVHDIENHGIEKILTLRVGNTLLRATVPAMVEVAVEDPIRFGLRTDKVMMFDKATGVNLAHKAA